MRDAFLKLTFNLTRHSKNMAFMRQTLAAKYASAMTQDVHTP